MEEEVIIFDPVGELQKIVDLIEKNNKERWNNDGVQTSGYHRRSVHGMRGGD